MSLVSNFGNASLGYNRSSMGLVSLNVMDRSPDLSMETLFNVTPSGMSDEPQSFTQSLISGNTRTESLTETMRPVTSYTSPKINTQSKKRDANKVVTDGKQVTQQLSNAKNENDKQIANFQKDWKQAKHEVLDALKSSAEDNPNPDITSASAVNALIPDSSSGKGAAVAYIAGAAVSSHLGAAFTLYNGIDDRKLSREDQEALLEDTMKRLQAPVVSMDTRDNGSGGGSVPMDAPKKSDVAYENMKTADLAEFLAADQDGLDQPEMQDLLQVDYDIKDAQNHNAQTAYNYDKTNVMEKAVNLASTGQSKAVAREFNNNIIAVDAPAVDLSGQMLGGITKINVGNTMAANDAVFASVTDISTKIDETKVDYGILTNELKGYAMDQFNIG